MFACDSWTTLCFDATLLLLLCTSGDLDDAANCAKAENCWISVSWSATHWLSKLKYLETTKYFTSVSYFWGCSQCSSLKSGSDPVSSFILEHLVICDVSQKSHKKIAPILWVMFELGLLSLIWLLFSDFFCFVLFFVAAKPLQKFMDINFFNVWSLKWIISPAFLGSSQNIT